MSTVNIKQQCNTNIKQDT